MRNNNAARSSSVASKKKSSLEVEFPTPKEPKILFWDIETAGTNALCADGGFLLCFGFKWKGKPGECITILDYPGKHIHDDTNLLKAASKIIQEADLLVAHYGDWFDKKFVNSRLLQAGLPPLPPTRQVDTCRVSREVLKLSSNRLDNVAKFLKVKNRKLQKGDGWPNWWFGALRGDRKCITDMAKYCIQDVECLADVYQGLLPLINPKYLIDASIGEDRAMCSTCGGKVHYRGYYFSSKKLFRKFQCAKCGSWGHDQKPVMKAHKQYEG